MNTDEGGVTGTNRFQWIQPVHRLGDTELFIDSDALRQALAWQVATELVRRHPTRLRLYMGDIHQYGPALIPMIDLGEQGPTRQWGELFLMTWGEGCHITPTSLAQRVGFDDHLFADGRFNWLDVLLAPDRRQYVVAELERQAGLRPPARTPSTTRATIGARLVSAFFSKTALAPQFRWGATNARVESDDGIFLDEQMLNAMPAVKSDWARRDQKDMWSTARYWFICHGNPESGETWAPVAAVDFVSGILWSTDGTRRDLMALYTKHNRKIDALVSRYLPPTQ